MMVYKHRNTGQVIRTTGRVIGDIWALQEEPESNIAESGEKSDMAAPAKTTTQTKKKPAQKTTSKKNTPTKKPAKPKATKAKEVSE